NAGNIEVTAEQVTLNHSTINTSSANTDNTRPGNITFNADTFSATDSLILATGGGAINGGGNAAVTIQGLQGPGAIAHAVSLTNTTVSTSNGAICCFSNRDGGPIIIRADNIALNQSVLAANSIEGEGGPITLVSGGSLAIQNSRLSSGSFLL